MARRHPVEPLERIGLIAGAEFVKPILGLGKLGKKLGGNFRAYFVAAWADGRADCGDHVGRFGAVFELHAAERFHRDAAQGAAPAGVNRGNHAIPGVDQEDGDAIGGLDGEEQTGFGGGGSIAFARVGRTVSEGANQVGMKLAQRNELQLFSADSFPEPAAIFEDVFSRVPIHETEIQDGPTIDLADAAGTSAETVNEPRQLGERCSLENEHATGPAFDPLGRRLLCSFARELPARGREMFPPGHDSPSIIAFERRPKTGGG